MKNIKKYLSAASAAFILCSAVTCHGLSAADLASVSQGEVARYIVIGGVFIAFIGVLLLLLSFLKPKKRDYADDFYDDDFAFIAGYTSGGAPYGIRWEDVGIDPDLPLEQKYSLYYEEKELNESEIEEDELPF